MGHSRRTTHAKSKRPRPSGKSLPVVEELHHSGARSATPSKLTYAQEQLRHQYAAMVDEDCVKYFVNTLHDFAEQISNSSEVDNSCTLRMTLYSTADLNVLLGLYQAIRDIPARGAISHTPVKLLSDVIAILRARINETIRCISQNRSAAHTISHNTSLGLIAAAIVLSFLCAPDCPRSLFIEDLIESVASLLRLAAQSVIFPASDPMFKNLKSKSDRADVSQSLDEENDSVDESFVPTSKNITKTSSARKRSRSSNQTGKGDMNLQVHFSILLDEFASLFRVEHQLPDAVVSNCSSVCIQCMSVSGVTRIQSEALKTAAVIFSSYPSHRPTMLNDLRQVIERVPIERRMLRTYQLSDSKDSVRFPSALLCTLLTASISDASAGTSNIDFILTEDTFEAWSKARLVRFNECGKLVVLFLEPLVSRACSDREPEFRTAFQTFFEDLLTLYGKPDWPVVEITLQTLSHTVITKLRAGGAKNIYSRCFAIDLLGALVCRMGQIFGVGLLQETHPLLLSSLSKTNLAEVEGYREDLLLFLGTDKSSHFAQSFSYLEALFLYEDVVVARNHAEDKNETSSKPKAVYKNQSNENVLQTLYSDEVVLGDVRSTTLKRRDNLSIRRQRGEVVGRRAAEDALMHLGVCFNLVGGFRTLLEVILDGLRDPAPTVRAKSVRAISTIDDGCQALFQTIPDIQALVQDSCRDVSTLVRDAALDLLSRSMFHDVNMSVMSPTLSGLPGSQYSTAENPNVYREVFETVIRRLSDSATSVRKRAISIIGNVLSNALTVSRGENGSNPLGTPTASETDIAEERIVRICSSLVSRLDDPESTVRSAAEKVLRLALFHFDPSKGRSSESDEDPSEARKLAKRLVSVFMNLQPKLHSTFLSRVVHSDVLTKHRLLLSGMVTASVDQLHLHEAEASKLVSGRALRTLSESEQRAVKDLSAQRIGSSSVILALAHLDASLVEPHCQSLAPILKDALNGEVIEADLITVQKILQVLEVGITQNGAKDSEFLEEVASDVEAMVCQSPTVILEEAAVRCMCAVSALIEQGENDIIYRNAKIFKKFLDDSVEPFLQYYRDKDLKQIVSLERNGRCAAIRLGLLSRYGDLGDAFISEIFETLSNTSTSLAVFDWRGQLLKATVRALSHFLVRHRSFIGDGAKTLVDIIGKVDSIESSLPIISTSVCQVSESQQNKCFENLSVGIQLCVLQGFHDLLKDEEDRNAAKVTAGDPKSKSSREGNPEENEPGPGAKSKIHPSLAAEEDAEAGYLALGTQIILPSVIECTYSSTTVLRRIVASVMGLLVRQGLLLPATVVPCLLTLLLDQDAACRELSMRVVSFLSERHNAMLASAVVPSLRSCFECAYNIYRKSCIQKLQSTTEDSDASEELPMSLDVVRAIALDQKTGQSVLSGALMGLHRDQRKGILHGMIREFDPNVVVVDRNKVKNSNKCQKQEEAVDCKIVEEDANDYEDEVSIELMKVEHADQKECTLATLSFFGITLACLDFTNGTGFGGSLTQGGGTVTADGKMRVAREDVVELVGYMTRIVSNSGQAILQVAKQEQNEHGSAAGVGRERKQMVKWISQICLLLQMKHHLKVERWKDRSDVDESADVSCTLPDFEINTEVVELVGWRDVSDYQDIDDDMFRRQVDLLVRLMREDAIDDKDMTPRVRRGKRNGIRNKEDLSVGTSATPSGRKPRKQTRVRGKPVETALHEGHGERNSARDGFESPSASDD